MDEIEIVEMSPQTVLGIRRRGPYSHIPEMLMEIWAVIMEKGAIPAGPPVFVCRQTAIAEVEQAVASGDADLEVAFPVANRVKPEGYVEYYTLPGGRFAKVLHRGPYERCTATYERFYAWLAEHGLAITGPIREYYLNDPSEVAPEEILTEILAPIG
ncbi:MAG: GyrI-like domain-containing protein [Methanospirillum sp.]